MHYEGLKFYLAESDISDALSEINDIITNVNNCLSSKPSGYEYSGDLTILSEEMSSIKTKINDIKGKVSELGTNLCNLDSSFGSAYMSYISANIDNILDGIDEGTYQMTDNEQINEMIYKALLELEATGALDEDMKADYIASKFSDIPKSDKQIIDILFKNPSFVYKGTSLYTDVGDYKHSIEYNAYEVYDPNNDRTYRIQRFINSDISINEIVSTVNSMPKSLSENNKVITVTSMASSTDAYWQDYYNDSSFKCAAVGGDNNINLYLSNNYGIEWAKSTIYHESAHNDDIVSGKYSISDSEDWKRAVESDYNNRENADSLYISQYGTRLSSEYSMQAYNSYVQQNGLDAKGKYCEDYAEAVRNLYYLGAEEYTKQYPARAEILKKELPEMFE